MRRGIPGAIGVNNYSESGAIAQGAISRWEGFKKSDNQTNGAPQFKMALPECWGDMLGARKSSILVPGHRVAGRGPITTGRAAEERWQAREV